MHSLFFLKMCFIDYGGFLFIHFYKIFHLEEEHHHELIFTGKTQALWDWLIFPFSSQWLKQGTKKKKVEGEEIRACVLRSSLEIMSSFPLCLRKVDT